MNEVFNVVGGFSLGVLAAGVGVMSSSRPAGDLADRVFRRYLMVASLAGLVTPLPTAIAFSIGYIQPAVLTFVIWTCFEMGSEGVKGHTAGTKPMRVFGMILRPAVSLVALSAVSRYLHSWL